MTPLTPSEQGSKVGIWSKVSKKFVFGIAEDNANDAYAALRKKIAHHDMKKYRWVCKPIPKEGRHDE